LQSAIKTSQQQLSSEKWLFGHCKSENKNDSLLAQTQAADNVRESRFLLDLAVKIICLRLLIFFFFLAMLAVTCCIFGQSIGVK